MGLTYTFTDVTHNFTSYKKMEIQLFSRTMKEMAFLVIREEIAQSYSDNYFGNLRQPVTHILLRL